MFYVSAGADRGARVALAALTTLGSGSAGTEADYVQCSPGSYTLFILKYPHIVNRTLHYADKKKVETIIGTARCRLILDVLTFCSLVVETCIQGNATPTAYRNTLT